MPEQRLVSSGPGKGNRVAKRVEWFEVPRQRRDDTSFKNTFPGTAVTSLFSSQHNALCAELLVSIISSLKRPPERNQPQHSGAAAFCEQQAFRGTVTADSDYSSPSHRIHAPKSLILTFEFFFPMISSSCSFIYFIKKKPLASVQMASNRVKERKSSIIFQKKKSNFFRWRVFVIQLIGENNAVSS